MDRVKINCCEFDNLLSLPGVGHRIARQIWELREERDNLRFADLGEIPYLRIGDAFMEMVDFSTRGKGDGDTESIDREVAADQGKTNRPGAGPNPKRSLNFYEDGIRGFPNYERGRENESYL